MRKILLRSLHTNSGFLEGADLSFAPGLTCIIGARGTCKSTVVESIRFAFNSNPNRVDETLDDEKGIVRKTLGSGSVRCVVDVVDDRLTTNLTIEREIGDSPRVLRGGTRDISSDDVLDEIEIFSQGAMQRIASSKEPELRLELIDRPHRAQVVRLKAAIDRDAIELRGIGSRLRVLRSEIETHRVQVRDIEQLRADLGATLDGRPELPPTLEEQHKQYLQRQRTLELLHEIENSQRTIATKLDDIVSERIQLEDLAARAIDRENICADLPTILIDQLRAVLDRVAQSEQDISGVPVAAEASALSARFQSLNEAYLQQRQQQQAVSESLRREDHLRRRMAELEKVERDLLQLEEQRSTFLARRRTLRDHLTELRDQVFELRVAAADQINAQFGDVVLLSLKRATRSHRYVAQLADLMSGSRVRMQGDIAQELATNLLPSELLEIVEDGDAQRLSLLLGRDLGQVNRIVTYLRDHPDLYELEGEWTDDSLDITMFDGGVPKPVEQLSDGQRATALLPLILRDSSAPLIVDQPEDDLDNSFIYQVLVKNIIRLKKTRQLIFVTHNANVPVLGDAEQIIVMHMDSPTRAGSPKIGSLDECKDDVLHLLEGGREAFEYREKSYHSLLT